jgi:hypothetical protein
MKKRILTFLIVVSMALFGSMAFAGDDWQDGFAKALDQNNLAGAMTLAHNSQASPHAVYEALEAFGVEQEDVGESIINPTPIIAVVDCDWYRRKCCDASDPPTGQIAIMCRGLEAPPNECTCSGSD